MLAVFWIYDICHPPFPFFSTLLLLFPVPSLLFPLLFPAPFPSSPFPISPTYLSFVFLFRIGSLCMTRDSPDLMILVPLLESLVCEYAPLHSASAFTVCSCQTFVPPCRKFFASKIFLFLVFSPPSELFTKWKGINGAALLWDKYTEFGSSLDSWGVLSGLGFS